MTFNPRGFSSRPRRAKGGIKAHSENGAFGRNWWAKKWLAALEKIMFRARLQRGQSYARMGQVLAIEELPDGMIAKVQGSRPKPYKVTIRARALTEEQWEKVLDALSGRAIFAAQLLAGEMPENIEEAFSAAGVSLFPRRSGDLITHCSCPDWANPCKHVAAVIYILGDRFDEDPFLLFRLRGRTQEQILDGLRQRRSSAGEGFESVENAVEPEEAYIAPLEETVGRFWELADPLDDFAVHVALPSIDLPILKRLGEVDFTQGYSLNDLLGSAYQSISQAAMLIAYQGMEVDLPVEEEV